MLAVISPAKNLDFSAAPGGLPFTLPERLVESAGLIEVLRKFGVRKLAQLMDLSEKLAALNHDRYHAWTMDFAEAQRDGRAKQALLAFDGEVYRGFSLGDFAPSDFAYAQDHLRILSGLHGVLRPLDLIQPYRLEMGRQLKTRRGGDLYAYWGPLITEALNEALDTDGSGVLLNLASGEYFASVQPDRLRGKVVACSFRDESRGAFRVLNLFAKRARGLMADFMIRNRVAEPEHLKDFSAEGYRFDPKSSSADQQVFLRTEKARKSAIRVTPARRQ